MSGGNGIAGRTGTATIGGVETRVRVDVDHGNGIWRVSVLPGAPGHVKRHTIRKNAGESMPEYELRVTSANKYDVGAVVVTLDD